MKEVDISREKEKGLEDNSTDTESFSCSSDEETEKKSETVHSSPLHSTMGQKRVHLPTFPCCSLEHGRVMMNRGGELEIALRNIFVTEKYSEEQTFQRCRCGSACKCGEIQNSWPRFPQLMETQTSQPALPIQLEQLEHVSISDTQSSETKKASHESNPKPTLSASIYIWKATITREMPLQSPNYTRDPYDSTYYLFKQFPLYAGESLNSFQGRLLLT